jgi:hypothetical protein
VRREAKVEPKVEKLATAEKANPTKERIAEKSGNNCWSCSWEASGGVRDHSKYCGDAKGFEAWRKKKFGGMQGVGRAPAGESCRAL